MYKIRIDYVSTIILILYISSFSLVDSTQNVGEDGIFFQNFLYETAEESGINACHANETIQDVMDESISKLVEALDGPLRGRLLAGARQTMRLEDMTDESTNPIGASVKPMAKAKFNFKPRPYSLLDLTRDIEEETNPRIVQARRRVDFEETLNGLRNLGQVKRLPEHQEEYMLEAATEMVEHDSFNYEVTTLAAPGRSIGSTIVKTAVNLVKRFSQLFSLGFKLTEMFFEAPEFLLNIPVLGDKVKEYRAKGETLYRMIALVRSASYIYKLKAVPDVKIDPAKVPVAKRILSQAGGRALRTFVHAALQKAGHAKVTEENTEKFVSDTFYALLSSVISAGNSCTMARD